MPRISGVDIPNNKRIEYALRYIYGIGPKLALDVLKDAQIEVGMQAKDLTEEQVTQIASVIDRSYQVEGQLRRTVQSNIARLSHGGGYDGRRRRADRRAMNVFPRKDG